MVSLESSENRPIGHHAVPDKGGGVADLDGFVLSFIVLARGEDRLRNDSLGLLMEKSGQKNKFFMIEAKSLAALGDAAVANHDRLLAGAERLADDVPLL